MSVKNSNNLSSGAHPTMTFPNGHLITPTSSQTKESKGAYPSGAFPNAHLAVRSDAGDNLTRGAPAWSAPEHDPKKHDPIEQLQQAVLQEDWARVFAEGKTKIQAQASWSAGPERCAMLRCLASMSSASRVLEVGSFCGVAALALAETIDKNGEVVALELEPYFVEFGATFRSRSQAGAKIKTMVGPALDYLKRLAAEVKISKPFDFVVIDGDKATMRQYFELITQTQDFLAPGAVVCLDITPFKGQVPTRFVKFGQAGHWEADSGNEHIAALHEVVKSSEEFSSYEFGGMLVVQRAGRRKKGGE